MSVIGVGVKNICYSWREPEFGSHNLHSGSQPFATPILGYPTPFSDLYRYQAHMWYTYIMEELRAPIDELEMIVDKDVWPVPSYGELTFEV